MSELDSAFRAAMRRLASGVSIVAVQTESGPQGLASTSVTSLSFDPLSLLFCISRDASAYEALSTADQYSINVLAADQVDVLSAFAKPEFRHLRFQQNGWVEQDGVIVLEGAQASIICERSKQITHGSHDIVIGTVIEVACRGSILPLLYVDGKTGELSNRETPQY